jgi:hypothetical protein
MALATTSAGGGATAEVPAEAATAETDQFLV